jgi:hypothetical protein
MPWLPTSNRIATRLGLTIGGGGAGWLTTLTVLHKPSTAAIVAAAVIAALVANAAESACKALPEIIKASGEAMVQIIEATAEAWTRIMRTRTRNQLLRAATDPAKTPQVLQIMEQLVVEPDLSTGRRLNDAALVRHARFLASRAKNVGTKPDSDPRKPPNDPRKPRGGPSDNVFPSTRPNRC